MLFCGLLTKEFVVSHVSPAEETTMKKGLTAIASR